MLQDWPEQKKFLLGLITEAIRQRTIASAPAVGLATHFTVSEGKKVVFVAPDGSRKDVEMEQYEARIELSKDELLTDKGQVVVDAIHSIGERLGGQMDMQMIQRLRQLPPTAGTMLHGDSTLGEQMLDALKSMDVEFDDGEPVGLAFLASPAAAERLVALNADAELGAEWDAILEEKRREWIRRESSRRLAD